VLSGEVDAGFGVVERHPIRQLHCQEETGGLRLGELGVAGREASATLGASEVPGA
jgi:hypothetical protein